MSLMSHVFSGLGCVLDDRFPTYTQVSHVPNVSSVSGLGCVLDEGSPAYTQVSHVSNVSCVFRFRLHVGRWVSCLHPGVTCL